MGSKTRTAMMATPTKHRAEQGTAADIGEPVLVQPPSGEDLDHVRLPVPTPRGTVSHPRPPPEEATAANRCSHRGPGRSETPSPPMDTAHHLNIDDEHLVDDVLEQLSANQQAARPVSEQRRSESGVMTFVPGPDVTRSGCDLRCTS